MADDATASVFRALADPTRRQILEDLREVDLSAGDIASRFTIKGPSVSRHLSILKAAGLVSERRDANRILYSLVEDRLALCVGGFLSAVCPEQVVLRHRRPSRAKKATS
jgi:DNA-binding transcriptional ArsR family regulator